MELFPFSRRLVLAVVASAAGGMGGAFAAADIPLELPKYTVTSERELPPPEQWHYARIDGFEVLSSAPAHATRKLVGDFQNFAYAVDLIWPGLRVAVGLPAALLICGQSAQFEKFLPATARSREQVVVSYQAAERAAIILDTQNRLLNRQLEDAASPAPAGDADAAPEATANAGLAVDTYQQLYREYIHFLLSRQRTPPPPWLAEGVAQLLMNLHLTETEISVGRVADPNSAEPNGSDAQFNAALAKRGLLPLGEMFAAHPAGDTAPSQLDQTWTKQCYAFVHWGLYGDYGKHQKEFLTFVRRLDREPLTEALFKECFKQDYAQMLQSLRVHIESTRFKFAGVRADKGTKIPWPPAAELRDATQAEVGRLQGEALTLAGRPAEARSVLLTAYLRGERDPALLAALGAAEASGGDVAKARKLLEASAAAHVVQPRAYVELARLRLSAATAHPEGAGGKLSIRQTAAVLEPLFVARSQPPPLSETYELVAETWTDSEALPNAGQLAVLDEGVRLNPRNAPLVYADAALKAKIGLTAEAGSLVRLGLRVTTDPGLRAKFEALQAGLPSTTPAAPAK